MSLSLLRVVGRRLMNAVPILLVTLAVAFWLIQLAPGDVYTEYALNTDIRAEDLERFRANFGLDQPWYVQFGRYLWNAAQGDFGFSQTFKAPVFALVSQRAANTLLLAVVALLLAWGFSIPAGIIAAARLYFDNIDHIDASWFSEGKKTGQVALHFGADDFGGTLFDENVMQEAGHYVRTSVEEMQTMIREAGFTPAQRDTHYQILKTFDSHPLPA